MPKTGLTIAATTYTNMKSALGDFPWRVNDRFTYTYDFGDY